jgi:hypothetical protein
MKTSRWKPLPDDVMGAARELVVQLRLLMDRAGVSLRQLAAADNVPYSVMSLRRFLSGKVLPPGQLIEVIADRCDGDREQLLSTLDRAVAAKDAGLPWAARTASRRRRTLRGRRGLVIAAVVGFVVGTNVLTGVVVVRLADRPAGAVARTPPAPSSTVSGAPTPSPAAASPSPPTGSPTIPPAGRPSRGDGPATQEMSDNLIRNGTFTGTTTSWWAVSDVRVRVDADRLRADARGGGGQSWARIVSADGFPLRAGRAYTLTFDAAAGADITDRVTVQRDSEPYTEAIGRDIDLAPSMRRFSYRFTAGFTTDQAALNFELGGHATDHTIWLDNVTLTPM